MNDLTLWDQPEEKWLSFKNARNFARLYELEYYEEWCSLLGEEYKNKESLPDNIPQNPDVIYRNVGWKGWSDWLISPSDKKIYSSFFKACEFTRSLRLKSKKQWMEYISQKNPLNLKYKISIPVKPWLEYKDAGWEGWSDWLGTKIQFKDFKTTKKFVRTLKFGTISDWKDYCDGNSIKYGRKAKNIYACPDIAFKNNGWKSWDDWFGISLFSGGEKEKPTGLLEGARHCRCKGLIYSCDICDGKGYYFYT